MTKQLACIKACSVELYFSARLFKVSPGCTWSVTQPPGTGQSVGGAEVKVAVAEEVDVGERVAVEVSMLVAPEVGVGEGDSVCVAVCVGGAIRLWTAGLVAVSTCDGSSATRSIPSVNATEKLPSTMVADSRAAAAPKSTWRISLMPVDLSAIVTPAQHIQAVRR